LLPITFPSTISELPLEDAKTFTTNSGAEVPKATTVRPITILEIPILAARLEAESTSLSAPTIRATKPKRSRKIFNNMNLKLGGKYTFKEKEIRPKIKKLHLRFVLKKLQIFIVSQTNFYFGIFTFSKYNYAFRLHF